MPDPTPPEVREIVAGLTEAQRDFLIKGEEGIFVDRRTARALCGKGLMGVAGYVIGETVYAFTHDGLAVRSALIQETRNGEKADDV